MSENGSNSAGQLRSIVDRILRLKAEQDERAADVREVYAEAKANGFDKTALGKLVAYLRKVERDGEKVAENEAIFETYLASYESTGGSLMRVRSTDWATAKAAVVQAPPRSGPYSTHTEEERPSPGTVGESPATYRNGGNH